MKLWIFCGKVFVVFLFPMAFTLLDGKTVSASVLKRVRNDVKGLKKKGIQPKLAFVLVGNNPASLAYVSQKEKACEACGIAFLRREFPENISTKKLIRVIENFNRDKKIHGILVQLPLPRQIDTQKIIQTINPKKDVDGFHPLNLGLVFSGVSISADHLSPCTPKGVIRMLDFYKIPIEGMHAVVVGKSNIVGKPLAVMLLNRGATVTICHRRTRSLISHTKQADILCVAAGKPGLIRGNMVKKGCVVIDVGFNRLESGKIVGDVIFDSVKKVARYLTPVPGGIGPMTVSCLMENIIQAASRT